MTSVPAVRCSACNFAWNSATMAEGLRLLGACPKCSGELVFRPVSEARHNRDPVLAGEGTAPHLVLGIPRR